MDYRISSLESDVRRICDELKNMSGRVFDLELERECKRQRRVTFLQALLAFSAFLFWFFLIAAIVVHPE